MTGDVGGGSLSEMESGSLGKEESLRRRCLSLEQRNGKEEQGFEVSSVGVGETAEEVELRNIVLEAELEALKSEKAVLQEKVDKYVNMCSDLGREVAHLEEDLVVASEKVASLECCNKRYEDEISDLKSRCAELEKEIVLLKESKHMNVETHIESNISGADKVKNELADMDMCPNDPTKVVIYSSTPVQPKRKKMNCENLFLDAESPENSPITGNTYPGNSPLNSLQSFKMQKIDGMSTRGKRFPSMVRKQLSFKEELVSGPEMLSTPIRGQPLHRDVILIIDDDKETVITPVSSDEIAYIGTSQDSGKDDVVASLKGRSDTSSPPHLSKKQSNQMIESTVKCSTSSCKEDFLSPLTPKKKRKVKVIASDSEDEVEEGFLGHIPANTFLTMNDRDSQKNEMDMDSPANQSDEDSSIPSETDDIEESIAPSRRRLRPLRKCRAVKWPNGTSTDHSTGKNRVPLTQNEVLGTGTSHLMPEGGSTGIAGGDRIEVNLDSERKRFSVSSENIDLEESITSPKRHLPPRSCKGKKHSSTGVSTTPHQLSALARVENGSVDTGKNSHGRPGKAVSGSSEVDDAEDVDSQSETESLGGFIVESTASECEYSSHGTGDESDSDSDSGDSGLQQLFRMHGNSSKWVDEGSMLASLGKSPVLCMKAICALYQRQTSEEQSTKGTIYHNKRGFNTLDAPRASLLVEFLTAGDPHGRVTKSLEELKAYDPSGPELCRSLAFRYSRQLFEIYKNGEDPHFHP